MVTVSTAPGANPGWRTLSFSYNRAMVEEIKSTVPARYRAYQPEDKTWSVAPEAYGDIISKLQSAPHNAVTQMGVEDEVAVSQVGCSDCWMHELRLTLA